MGRIRTVVVDDSRHFLEGMIACFRTDTLIRIVGVASTGMEALDMVDRLRPDLVLLDVRMFPMGGLETLRCLKADPAAPVVVLTTFHLADEARREALASGADRFLPKSELVEGLTAIAREMTGGTGGRCDAPRRHCPPGPAPPLPR